MLPNRLVFCRADFEYNECRARQVLFKALIDTYLVNAFSVLIGWDGYTWGDARKLAYPRQL